MDEIPVKKLQILIDYTRVIIENTKVNKEYVFGILEYIYLNIDDSPDMVRKKIYLKKEKEIKIRKNRRVCKVYFS